MAWDTFVFLLSTIWLAMAVAGLAYVLFA